MEQINLMALGIIEQEIALGIIEQEMIWELDN